MSELSVPPFVAEDRQRRRHKRRRMLLIFLLALALIAAALVGVYKYKRYELEQELTEAIAETDRLDPGWRLEDIDRDRTTVPLEQNAAVPVMAALDMLWPVWSGEIGPKDAPQRRLDPQRVVALRKVVQPFLPAAIEAQKALPLKAAQYLMPAGWNEPPVVDIAKVTSLGLFLSDVTALHSEDGEHDQAVETTLTILAVARSFEEEPWLIDVVSITPPLLQIAATSLERCLAQGPVSDSVLARAQEILTEEATKPRYYLFLRAYRALMHRQMTKLESGKIKLEQFIPASLRTEFKFRIYLAAPTLEKDHAWLLRYVNEALQLAKLPPAEMTVKSRELYELKQKAAPPFAGIVMPRWRLSEVEAELRAQLECAATAIAVERFRLRDGRWPETLEEVVKAKLLDKMPLDLYDGKPLGYRRMPDGVVVSATGPEVKRIEFRLWDEDQRGQPPQENLETKLKSKL
jgi:hypothetical protein